MKQSIHLMVLLIALQHFPVFGQRLTFGVKQNLIGWSRSKDGAIGSMAYASNQMFYRNDPSFNNKETFNYIWFNKQTLTTETGLLGSPVIPRFFLRYYAKNKFFADITYDLFRVKAQPGMMIADKAQETKLNRTDPYKSGITGAKYLDGSYDNYAFSLTPSFNYFLYERRLIKPYLIIGVPFYVFNYKSDESDILSPPEFPDVTSPTKEQQQYFFSKVDLNKLVINYQIGAGLHIYEFFIEAAYTNNITALQDNDLFTSFPRLALKVGANVVSLKKIFRDTFRKEIMPRETE